MTTTTTKSSTTNDDELKSSSQPNQPMITTTTAIEAKTESTDETQITAESEVEPDSAKGNSDNNDTTIDDDKKRNKKKKTNKKTFRLKNIQLKTKLNTLEDANQQLALNQEHLNDEVYCYQKLAPLSMCTFFIVFLSTFVVMAICHGHFYRMEQYGASAIKTLKTRTWVSLQHPDLCFGHHQDTVFLPDYNIHKNGSIVVHTCTPDGASGQSELLEHSEDFKWFNLDPNHRAKSGYVHLKLPEGRHRFNYTSGKATLIIARYHLDKKPLAIDCDVQIFKINNDGLASRFFPPNVGSQYFHDMWVIGRSKYPTTSDNEYHNDDIQVKLSSDFKYLTEIKWG